MMEFERFNDSENGKAFVRGAYSNTELLNKTIIRDEVTNHYIVFDTKESFELWYNLKKERHYHEIILGHQPQRLKFDIDITDTVNINEVINCILNTIISTLDELYYGIDDVSLDRNNFVVTDSSGHVGSVYKHSYHIILYTHALANATEAKHITNAVIDNLPTEYVKYIDKNVNKSVQNFRILLSCKYKSIRQKVISTTFETSLPVLLDTMIVPFKGIQILEQLCEENCDIIIGETIDDENIKQILKIAKSFNILDGHKFRDIKNNSINFDRIKPTYCSLCDEIHHKDNSLILQYDDISGNIYEFCRQSKKNKYVYNIKENKKSTVNVNVNAEVNVSKFELCDKNIYSCDHMKEYELVPTLAVKAQMKLGKTKMLHAFIKTHFDESIIRFITFRQTFSNHIYGLFNDFELYSNIKGSISSDKHKKVIVQVESLYRLQLDEENIIDLLVLDEVESILSQLGSGLHKNFNSSFAMFLWMLSTAKHVICMDANLSDRTYNILMKFRKHDIFFHCNKWQSSKDDIFYITDDKNLWISHLIEHIEDDKKIVVPTNSITEAKTCELLIREAFPNINIRVYSSEMKQSEKQLHFNDVHKYWTELDVLIYTPTCSAGVSYELEHFDVVFGYFCNMSCDVETCRQMINRVRNIKSKEHYLYLQEIDMATLPVTSKEIHNYLYNKRANLCNYIHDSNLQWSYDISGAIKFYETDYYYIWLENMAIANSSKNKFVLRFCSQLRESGALIKNMTYTSNDIANEHCAIQKKVEEKQYADISSAEDISIEEAENIINKMSQQLDIELPERMSYEKYKLRTVYNYRDPMTSRFVEFYRPKHVQRIYKNLCDIAKYDTIEQSIEFILKMENERFSNIVSSTSLYKNKIEQYDLHHDSTLYTSLSHIIISKIIVFLGTKSLTLLEYNKIIDDDIGPLIDMHDKYLSIELNIRINQDKKAMLNSLLKNMYGLRVYKNGSKVRLKKCDGTGNLFTFSRTRMSHGVVIITNNEIFLSLK